MNSDDRHYRVLVWGLPSPLLGSLLLLLSQSMNTLLLPQLLPGTAAPTPGMLAKATANATVVLSATVDVRYPLSDTQSRFKPHLSILAVRHPAHAAVELGGARAQSAFWDEGRLEALDGAYRGRHALFNETVVLETLALHRREPLALLKRLGLPAQIASDMLAMPRSPADVQRHSLFHCGPWCRNRTQTSWELAPLSTFLRGATMSAERSLRARPLPTRDLLESSKRLCPTLSHFYDARFPELAIIDKGVAKRWTQSVVHLMQLVDSRALLASTAPPPPPPKSAVEIAAEEQRGALLILEAQRRAEQETKNRKREETNTDDAAVSEAFGDGSVLAKKVEKPKTSITRRSGVVGIREAWVHDGKLIGAKPATRVKSGGLGGYEYTPAWGDTNRSVSSSSDGGTQAQLPEVQRRLFWGNNQSNAPIGPRTYLSFEPQRRLQARNFGGFDGGRMSSNAAAGGGVGAGLRSSVYATASKRAASTAQRRGATSAGQQAAAALAANRKAAAEWAASQPGYQPPRVAPWLKEAKNRLEKGGGPLPPIGAARGGGYEMRAAGGGGTGGKGAGSRSSAYQGAPRVHGTQPFSQNSHRADSNSRSSRNSRQNDGEVSNRFNKNGAGGYDVAEMPVSAEAAAREERRAAFLEAHTRRRHAEKHRTEVLAAEAASGGDRGDGRLSPRAAASGAPGALHWQAIAAAGGAPGRAQVVVVAAADYAWRGLALNWCLGLERIGVHNYVLFAADAEAHTFFKELGAPSFHYADTGGKQLFSDPSTDNSAGLRGVLGVGSDRRDELWAASVPGGASAIAAKAVRWHRHGQLWWYRWRFIAEILKRGVDVVHSDADAVWVRNPFPLLAYAEVHAPGRAPSNRGAAAALSARQHKLMSRASLVASRGALRPHWLVCMGFLVVRASSQVLAMLPTFLGNLQEYGDDQRSWNMAMDTMGRLSWQGNPLLEANEDELLVGLTKHGLLVALLPNQSVRRTGCSPTSIARTRPFILGDPRRTAAGDGSIEEDSVASMYPEVTAARSISRSSGHEPPNEAEHDDWVGDDDNPAIAQATSPMPKEAAVQDGAFDKPFNGESTDSTNVYFDREDGAMLSINSSGSSSSSSRGSHEIFPDSKNWRTVLPDIPPISAPNYIENSTSNSSSSGSMPTVPTLSQPERNLLVAHCRDLSSKTGGRASLLTQNSSVIAKQSGLRELKLWWLPQDWSFQAHRRMNARAKERRDRESSGAESPAAVLLRLIQAHPDDPGVLRRAASTAGVANAALGGGAATNGNGRNQNRDHLKNIDTSTAPLDFSEWSNWIVALDDTFSAAAAAAAAGDAADASTSTGNEGLAASGTASANLVGARLPEPGTGPFLPNLRRRNGRSRMASALPFMTAPLAVGSAQPFKRGGSGDASVH